MGMPILIVDDEADIRSLLAYLLASEGYESRQAENGQHALELLRNGLAPAAIILDMKMPGMDGGEFLQVKTADGALEAIPVIVTTASGKEGPPDNVAAVLQKPYHPGELLRELHRILPAAERSQAHDG
jgi:CheY-like chemotaxis protein